ncbi:MAG: hypothetical protein HQL10_10525 [Nitrospirae bacterium]|nr:hypothetical protein [Nitrospirota bacterium]
MLKKIKKLLRKKDKDDELSQEAMRPTCEDCYHCVIKEAKYDSGIGRYGKFDTGLYSEPLTYYCKNGRFCAQIVRTNVLQYRDWEEVVTESKILLHDSKENRSKMQKILFNKAKACSHIRLKTF